MLENKILAIIPARGGSKGLLRKNICPINGKPLIAYTIESSLSSGVITKTVVSTEDEEIKNVSKQFGADVVLRPIELASDTTPSEPVIEHVIKSLQNNDEYFDILVLLQPTSPLRSSNDVKMAITQFLASEATSLISVYEPSHTPYKAFKADENGYLNGLVDNKTPFMRRQDLPKTYMPNGAIYITYCDLFLKTLSLFSEKTVPYVMSVENSVDIDTYNDIKSIESFLNNIS